MSLVVYVEKSQDLTEDARIHMQELNLEVIALLGLRMYSYCF